MASRRRGKSLAAEHWKFQSWGVGRRQCSQCTAAAEPGLSMCDRHLKKNRIRASVRRSGERGRSHLTFRNY